MSKTISGDTSSAGDADPHSGHGKAKKSALVIGSLGVVFGDIGTSPLYAIKESFHDHGAGHLQVTSTNVTGLLSLVLWSLVLVICFKYLYFIMKADNDGEGGILALTALIREKDSKSRSLQGLILAGLFGAALLYGDGMITPAISVLSAVEGTEIITESLSSWVIPISVLILIALFSVQRRGTAQVGRAFGPIMVVWFAILGVLGLINIFKAPQILEAINPLEAISFFTNNGAIAFLAMGSVFLVVTGGEALYADMGHFGRIPITVAWYGIALPGLVLNYFGQGALLIDRPDAVENPFYQMVPRSVLVPMVIISTMATVIASQALISGAFSLTKQAVQLGYLPRVRILQTSEQERGQIYVPVINWILLVACVGLVIGFRKSTNLAAAYGLAVTGTMAITTILFYRVAVVKFGWNKLWAGLLCGAFLLTDLAFLGANIPKIPRGGWFPLIIGVMMLLILTTWFAGRRLMAERIAAMSTSMEEFVEVVRSSGHPRGPGVGVYLGANPAQVPQSLKTHFAHSGVLPKTVCVVSVAIGDVPHVSEADRFVCEPLGLDMFRIKFRLGYMDEVNIPALLETLASPAMDVDFSHATYVLGRESPRATNRPGMAMWRERLFVGMMRNASTADLYFQLPPARTLELGVQVDL